MPRYCQLVVGPAGSGKSTYCSTMVTHCEAIRRTVKVINLDPAAETFSYPVTGDVRELISVEDVMEDADLRLGPNGSLVFCMEYLLGRLDWLQEILSEDNDDFWLIDCPGQIELVTHTNIMSRIVRQLENWDFRVVTVFLLDSQFLVEPYKYIAGIMTALTSMVAMETPHVNVMSKVDLLDKGTQETLEQFLEPDLSSLLEESTCPLGKKFHKLNRMMVQLIDSFSMVRLVALNNEDEESIEEVLAECDQAIHFGEDAETREMKDPQEAEDDEEMWPGDIDSGMDVASDN